jgi:uncharacterized membrane protein
VTHVGPEYFAVLPLMSFGEAFVNGMVMAMMVVYRPKWVMSFDDRLYLRKGDGDRGQFRFSAIPGQRCRY